MSLILAFYCTRKSGSIPQKRIPTLQGNRDSIAVKFSKLNSHDPGKWAMNSAADPRCPMCGSFFTWTNYKPKGNRFYARLGSARYKKFMRWLPHPDRKLGRKAANAQFKVIK